MSRDFLLEIGTEEIPARFFSDALKQVKEIAEKLLSEHRLFYEEIYTYATPRRIVLFVKHLEEQQKPKEEKKKGPSQKAAFDEEGNPTKAALGFARKMGYNVEDLKVEKIDKGEYLVAVEKIEGKNTLQVLHEIAPSLIINITFPKSMYWDETRIRFARPIRWLLCLYGKEVISFSFGSLTASDTTKGHRLYSSGPIKISDPRSYFAVVKDAGVIVDQKERSALIEEELRAVASEQKVYPRIDPFLLEEVNYLVEQPQGVLCSFSRDYLSLPEEVLVTTLQRHQRYFPVENELGELAPYFVTVSNNKTAPITNIRHGNEKVVRARLADARFFYDEDLKSALEDYMPKLKNILFQVELGSLYDKAIRLQSLTEHIMKKLPYFEQNEKQAALRASYLAKADLATQVVGEFPELQGIMGRDYALKSGEDKETAKAIYEHYLPRYAGDYLPGGRAGAVTALSDKTDHVAGCFAVGIRPSGSQDPYGLRRQSLGIVQILLEHRFPIAIGELVDKALALLNNNMENLPFKEVKMEMMEFFRQRVRFFMQEKGVEYDLVEAVLNTPSFGNIPFTWERLKFLQDQRGEMLQKAALAYIRIANLSHHAGEQNEVQEDLLGESEEKELYKCFFEAEKIISQEIEKNNLHKVLHLLAELKEPVDLFFDEVLVMAEDEKIRTNRLALLKQLQELYVRLVDFSKIVFPG